ncbi:MAG: 4Fe-4S dicluster domain-containing protein [Promethearchaeota archaeon]|nr:MAG: 4Fe-4S dicluster domain-containing protein [Candidatus Lokiarchaeota archaeon]
MKEKFFPIQIDQNQCIKCERCVRACTEKAIYFKHGIRQVDYSKCKACLTCVQVCPRNAIVITSVVSQQQVLTVKIEHERCNLCLKCVDREVKLCPNNLFYKDKIRVNDKEIDVIKFKFKEIAKCQGCFKCELSCPEKAIKVIKFEG